MRKEDILDEQHWKFKDYRQRITTKQWKELLLTDDDRVIFQGRVCPLSGKNLGSGVVEDKMEYTVNGKTYRQLKEITVKALIKLDAPDADIESLLEDYGFTEPISLSYAIDYASSCNEKLQWLVDQGFVEVVEEALKPCPFCGGKPELMPSEKLHYGCPNQFTVCCSRDLNGCGATSGYGGTRQEAIKAWNKRVSV